MREIWVLSDFLLLNYSSHDLHFSTRQNIKPEEFLGRKSNFSLRGLSRYLTPNMALQNIILTSFVFLFKLKNYVFELNDSASVSHDFGSRKIFLLLNDSSHDSHFSACQNIETLDGIQKISNFSLHGFSRYSIPNMALQKIILTYFDFLSWTTTLFSLLGLLRYSTIWVFYDFFTPKRFEPRCPFSYTSKYGTWRIFRRKIKFFSPRVFQIFDSKHGSPENYSDFFCFLFFFFFFFPIEGYAFSAP